MPKIPSKSEEQKVAEANVEGFKSELGPFVVAAETTRMAMVMVFADAKQADNPIISLPGDCHGAGDHRHVD